MQGIVEKYSEQLAESGEEICEPPVEPGGLLITTNPDLVIALEAIEKDGKLYFVGLPKE